MPENGARFMYTSESVNEGHPDKLCDQVSDAVLDAVLEQDPDAKVACETCSKTNMVRDEGAFTLRDGLRRRAAVAADRADRARGGWGFCVFSGRGRGGVSRGGRRGAWRRGRWWRRQASRSRGAPLLVAGIGPAAAPLAPRCGRSRAADQYLSNVVGWRGAWRAARGARPRPRDRPPPGEGGRLARVVWLGGVPAPRARLPRRARAVWRSRAF